MSAARTEGVARLGKRTKDLTKRLRPGEIAIEVRVAGVNPATALR